MTATLTCPACGSDKVATASEQLFMVNSGKYYCESVKPHDADARATCLDCPWDGKRHQLVAGTPAKEAP